MDYLTSGDSQAGKIKGRLVKGVISSADGGDGYSVGFILNCRLNVFGMEAAHFEPQFCNFADALSLWTLVNLSTTNRVATPIGMNSLIVLTGQGHTGRPSGLIDFGNIGLFIASISFNKKTRR
jgi:hypothetical protein